ncbi:MAG: septum formation initiator family protein [Anaerolineales bacterium]|jgi:cell division protein FtsL
MNSVQRFTQAYENTPWRQQVQGIGLFLLILVLGALVSGIYLNVTARTATIGRQIQNLNFNIEKLERINADLQTQLAQLTTAVEMERRARQLGFRPVEPGETLFVVVQGYQEPSPTILAPPPQPTLALKTTMPTDFTESLLDWVKKQIYLPPLPIVEVWP